MSESRSEDLRFLLSRRNFLSVGAAGIATSILPGCAAYDPHEKADWSAPSSPTDNTWSDIRREFITTPGVTYMNNASLGMPPGVVAEAVWNGYRALSEDPIRAKHDLRDEIGQNVLPGLAAFLGVDPSEVILTRNATESLHLAATGLKLERGDHVIITTQAHPAGRQPWRYREAKHGILVSEVFVPSPIEDPQSVVASIEGAITSKTRAIAFSHVTRGGHLFPVRDLSAMASEKGIATIVDGAQALGMFPIDLSVLGCDVYAASIHKWLLGPMGTGMLYIRKGARENWESHYSEISTKDEPNYNPPGTSDLPLKAAVGTALTFANRIGIDAIEARTRYLSDYLKMQLAEVSRIQILSGGTRETSAPGSTIFEMDGVDALESVPAMLDAATIHIDEHQRDGHNALRISTHYYNSTDDIDRLISILQTW
ncbi:MAG: aminotransferase class V-fold PLP-dependent enzyme [Rhodothermia bacterium]|nr:MAG: aminotransferase class V-fold PLP-dependent enzyme [Rhodothermia bacterium]